MTFAQRPKRPYRAPIHRCFARGVAPEYVRELLSPSGLKASGVFNPHAVGQLLQKLDQGPVPWRDGRHGRGRDPVHAARYTSSSWPACARPRRSTGATV